MHYTSINLFFFNDTATTEIYTLSLHDALPISAIQNAYNASGGALKQVILIGHVTVPYSGNIMPDGHANHQRSEEHTSELQSQSNLVCRLLLEKKKQSHAALHERRAS